MAQEEGIVLELKPYSFNGSDGKFINGTNVTIYERNTKTIIHASTNQTFSEQDVETLPATCNYIKEYKHTAKGIKCKINVIEIYESI